MTTTTSRTSAIARRILLVVAVQVSLLPAFAQPILSGSVSCTASANGQFTGQGGGTFQYQVTQTWTITGGAPTLNGASWNYPGTWTAEGSGQKRPSTGGTIFYNTGWSQSRPLNLTQLSGSVWKVTPDLLTNQALGTFISGIKGAFSTPELAFPDTSNSNFPLENPGYPGTASVTPPVNIVAQQPGGAGSTITVTESCSWRFGTPDPGLKFIPLAAPCRTVDTRNVRRNAGVVYPTAPATFQITGTCGVPYSAKAYSLHVTVQPLQALDSLGVRPTGVLDPPLRILSAPDGLATGNAAIVAASYYGSVDVVVSNPTHVIIDVNGYFENPPVITLGNPDKSGLAYYALPAPCTAADTRNPNGPLGGPRIAGATVRMFPLQSTCGIPANVRSYVLNVKVLPRTVLSYLTVFPGGQPQPITSTVYAADGKVKSSMEIVHAGTNGEVSFFASDDTDLVVDIAGYFAYPGNPGARSFYPQTPCRMVDTQTGSPLAAQTVRDFQVVSTPACPAPPFWASAYFVNLTALPSGPVNSLTLWAPWQTQPANANVSAADGQAIANAAILRVGTNGSFRALSSGETNLTVDLGGYFGPIVAGWN